MGKLEKWPPKLLLVDSRTAGVMLGRRALFNHMLAAKWIKPVVNHHKCKLFCCEDIWSCVKRLKRGDKLPMGKV